MAVRVRWLCVAVAVWLWLTLLCYCPGDLSKISIFNTGFIREILEIHSQYRSHVRPGASDMYLLSWDDGLAKTARAWGRICNFAHNPDLRHLGKAHPEFDYIGENMYACPVHTFTVKASLNTWHKEVANFNYKTNHCNGSCNNYTQMVWASTYKIGCAVNYCGRGIQGFNRKPGNIFICNYGPPGNDMMSKPYNIGKPCLGCPEDICTIKQCSNTDREMIQKYLKWNPKYSLASVFFCNLPLLLTSIIAAYILQ